MGTWDTAIRRPAGIAQPPAHNWASDPVGFVSAKLNFTPDPIQARVLQGGRRGIVNCTRQWGKSTVMAAKAVHRADTRDGCLVLVMSPSARQSAEFLRKAEAFVTRLGIRPRGDGDNALSILFPNGSRIVGLPGTERTLRGFSNVSLMLIDEAARAPDDLYRAMRPSLATGDGDLWLISTPNGKRGFFWEEWTRGGPDWERISVPAEDCPRISARFLEEERAKGDHWYRQEYACEFLDHDGVVFPADLINAAFEEDFEELQLIL